MIRTEIKKLIQQAVKSVYQIDLELDEIKVEYPPEEFGDYSTNVALMLAKKTKKEPVETAKEILRQVQNDKKAQDIFVKSEVVKPGFINFYLKKEFLQKEVQEIGEQDKNYGDLDIGQKQKVQVEFISANPTGPLTLGNGRGGFYGDVLANVLKKSGFEVEREYYINNVGKQIDDLGHSILGDEQAQYKGNYVDELRNHPEKLKEWFKSEKWPGDLDELKVLLEPLTDAGAKEKGKIAAFVIFNHWIKTTIEKRMKINFDNWFSEASLFETGEVEKSLSYLQKKDLIFEREGALWFKSTEFGDDKDRVLVKADGEKTYLASDIAYLKNKFDRGFEKLIHIWGADHHGYIKRFKAAAEALGHDPEKVEVIIMQLVRLMEGGKEVKMSKRAGTYVTIEELIDEVGLDAARFFFLMYSPDAHMNFDLDLAKEKSEKNPVYYVQYAHARICSIFKKYNAKNANDDAKNANLNLLEHESELKLTKQLIKFSEVVEDVARDYQVHRLPHYAIDLVRTFHKFYEDCRVIDEKMPALMQARLVLVKATQIVLKNTLNLMGVLAPERM